jgi:hypothetical protein
LRPRLLARASHRLLEHKKSKPWKNHGWHARAELRMLQLTLRGQLRPVVRGTLSRRPSPRDLRAGEKTY